MNGKSKKKFNDAVNRIGLNKVCGLHSMKSKERHTTTSGKGKLNISYDSLTQQQRLGMRKIVPPSSPSRWTRNRWSKL